MEGACVGEGGGVKIILCRYAHNYSLLKVVLW